MLQKGRNKMRSNSCTGHLFLRVFVSTRIKEKLHDGKMTVHLITHVAKSSGCHECRIAVLIRRD